MEVKRYSDQYAEDIKRLVQEFQAESLAEYGMTYNDEALNQQIDALKHSAFIVEIDGHAQGILAGKEVYTPSGNDKVWHEVIWYMNENYRRYGLKLLAYGKEELKKEGFTHLVMVYMHNSKSDKLYDLYTRLGLTAMETNFIGRL